MNKTDLINVIADTTGSTKASAGAALDAAIEGIANALKQGETVTIVGFGTFSVRERAARAGRNPQTGESIKIAASKSPAFKPGKAFKDAV